MATLEQKKIVIKLPALERRTFMFLIIAALGFTSIFAYWYQNMRPYLWIESAHIETFSTLVSSDCAGRIVEMGPQEGDHVKKGETLFVFDRDLLLAKQAQAKRSSDALNQQVEIEKDRVGKAMEAYLIASSDLDFGSQDRVKLQLELMNEAQEKSERAALQVEELKTELSLLDLQLKKTVMTAPFDGIVLKRSANPGVVVSFGDPLYLLSDPDRMWVEAEVPEHEIGQVTIGTPARVRLLAYPKKELVGSVSYIGPATVAKSSQVFIPIKISIAKSEISLKPGLSATVALKVR